MYIAYPFYVIENSEILYSRMYTRFDFVYSVFSQLISITYLHFDIEWRCIKINNIIIDSKIMTLYSSYYN